MWAPDDAVIISLRRASHRRAVMENTMHRLGFPARLVDAVDAEQITAPINWSSSVQSYANAASHRQVLNAATGSILVLEDDAFIPGDFRARLEVVLQQAPDWELIMLGGQHVRPAIGHAPGVVRCAATIRSIGYIARGRALPLTLMALDRATRHWDGEWVNAQAALNVYAPDPFVITPSGAVSTIPDSTPYR